MSAASASVATTPSESRVRTSRPSLLAIERALAHVVVTPRMHGIHHSIVERETDSKWGTIFSLADYLHRTVRLNVPQQAIDHRHPRLPPRRGGAPRALAAHALRGPAPELAARGLRAEARSPTVKNRRRREARGSPHDGDHGLMARGRS
jgi:hypothetical protein